MLNALELTGRARTHIVQLEHPRVAIHRDAAGVDALVVGVADKALETRAVGGTPSGDSLEPSPAASRSQVT